jgi:FAD synthetase
MVKQSKGQTQKKVLVGGCFDILHYGHIHFLKRAKELGDYLVVALESDKNIQRLKGTNRPFHTQEQRREILESLKFVDEVIILKDEMHDSDYLELVNKVRPYLIAVTKGDNMIEKKRQHARTVLAKVIEIEKDEVPSTTQIAKLLEIE